MRAPDAEGGITPSRQRRKRIVVADDTRFWREKLIDILAPAGYELLGVEDGGPALKLCMNPLRFVDLLMLDLVMPGVDGFEVARQLRSRKFTKALPIVAVTSLIQPTDFPDGHRVRGFDAIVEKSSGPEHFRFVVNKYLHADAPSRRLAPRVPCYLPATFVTKILRHGKGFVTNISRMGAYLSTSALLRAGDQLSLHFSLPNGFPIRAPAEVARIGVRGSPDVTSYGRGIGIRFGRLDCSEERSLAAWVEKSLERV